MDCSKWFYSAVNSCPKDQRLGQWLVNELTALDKEHADNIPMDVDPYYDDKRIKAFESWLHATWSEH